MSTRKAKADGPFVMVTKKILDDPEWRSLSSSAKVVWIYLRSKFNYRTFSEVSLTYSEMKGVMSSATLSRAFKELIATDFIKQTKKGGLYGGVSKYKFTGPHGKFIYKKMEV